MSSVGSDDVIPPKSSSTESSAASDSVGGLPPRPGTTSSTLFGRKNRSEVWNFFTVDVDKKDKKNRRARCNFCKTFIKCADGTSAMHMHLKRCKDFSDKEANKRQKTLSFTSVSSQGDNDGSVQSPSPVSFKFDQDVCRDELVRMFIVAELSFKFVENEAFRKFLKVLQPKFIVPSRNTLTSDIYKLYDVEKMKLKSFLEKHCSRVCLTTDTWTSCQNFNYMCLTAHFIDNDWKLHKKILNFCQVTGHSGEVIGKSIEMCLNSWELSKIFSLTVDNASSNDVGIQYLKKRMASWGSMVLKGDYIHMRCCAHILSLIVKDGLSELDKSILKIRAAIKYVRSSPSRLSKFKSCAEQEKISYKGSVSLDVETRWNSTYLMLEGALKYQKAFELLELQDKKYVEELNEKGKELGVPGFEDWIYAQAILPFLKIFYDATMRISGTSYVTSNMYMREVFGIGEQILEHCKANDTSIQMMAKRMKRKYDKYWGNPNSINMLLLIAVVLDPRHKLQYVNWFIDYLFDKNHATELKTKLFATLNSLYDEYGNSNQDVENVQSEIPVEDVGKLYGMGLYLKSTGFKSNAKSELDKYLKEDCEPYNWCVELDLLSWWKVNSNRFPILGSIARDVLAIPVSTVASESAFSTEGRVLDPYRSRLTPTMVEVLICSQDWIKSTPFSMLSEEDFEELEKFEREMTSKSMVASSSVINDD